MLTKHVILRRSGARQDRCSEVNTVLAVIMGFSGWDCWVN